MNKTHLPQWLTLRLVILELVLLTIPLLLFALDLRSVHAQGACSGSKDYGDAPSSYGDACATPLASLRIGGVTPDSESGSVYSTNADGDDTTGTDDENFLNPLTPIDLAYPQYVWTVTVSNTTGSSATLAGWIDFDGSGTFDANERATATVPNGTVAVTLTWNIPITATPNITTYVRLRISTNPNVGPTGDYGNGEVEDYVVRTVQSIVCAPGRLFYYTQTSPTGGIIRLFDVSTGITTTINDPPTPASGITGINGVAVDQSRGMIYFQEAASSTSARGIYGYDVVANTNFTVTTDASTSPLNMSAVTNGWRTAAGAFANGKYYAGVDGGDAGTIYEVTFDSGGTAPVSARALFAPNPNCGRIVCQDYGDLLVIGNRIYVSYWSRTSTTQYQHLDIFDINSTLRLSSWYTSSAYGVPNPTWAYQLGRDGNGNIYAVRQDTGGVYAVDPSSGVVGALVRTIPGVSTDYPVTDASECPVVPMDFGDAPTSYGGDAGPRAARHALVSTNGITPTLYLGSARTITQTRDLRGFSSTNANGDDLYDYRGGTTAIDDEDAVSNIPRMSVLSTTYQITNIVVYNNTGSTAYLRGWVDFNRDGVFAQNEGVTVTVPSSTATQYITLTWSSLPTTPVYGMSYLRLRLSTSTVTTSTWGTGNDGAFLATGYAPDGEIEDYPVPIDNIPSAVTLSSFRAHSTPVIFDDQWLPVGIVTAITLGGIGGLILYWRERVRRRRMNL